MSKFFDYTVMFILKLFLMIGICIITFVISFQSFLSANLALNTFKGSDTIIKWFFTFIFAICGWCPFISPLWFYYIYPTTWVETGAFKNQAGIWEYPGMQYLL